MMHIDVRKWPVSEQPRERLLVQGAKVLTDGELLALVLGASNRHSGGVLAMSRRMLCRFGGLRGVLRSHPGALMTVNGIGQARACAIAAVMELARRLEDTALVRGHVVVSSRDVYALLRGRLSLLDYEAFVAVALDAKHRVLGVHQVAQGSATSVEVHPREVFTAAIREAGAALIVAHNHPSGDPEPSEQDCQLTERLADAGSLLGIPLLDHLVVGAGRFVSLADRGLI